MKKRMLVALILLFAAGVVLSPRGDAGPTAANVKQFGGPARVFAAPVIQKEVAAGQTFVGTVMPLRTSKVGSAVSGRVEEFLVDEGKPVKKGQPLARLWTKVISAELAAAKAELKLRQAELAEMENGSRPEEIDEAKQRVAAAEAHRQFRRSQRLRVQGAGRGFSPEEIEEAISLSNQADAVHEQARATLKLLELGPRQEKKDQARARADAAQAEVDRLEEQVARHTMVAPFDGYVVKEYTEVGEWLMQGAHVAEIAELDEVDIDVAVPEDYVGYLSEGASSRVEVGGLPDRAFTGRVALIVPKANERARTFPVKVRVANQREGNNVLIKAGMFARVTLPVGKKEPSLLVSKDALVLGGATRMVYVVDTDPQSPMKGKARPVPVELGVAEGNLIQVRGDLKPNQMVVTQGNERLRPGQDVEIATRK
jgi:RND family efflux transporter MFP subunit